MTADDRRRARFDGTVAVVTGGGAGIGLATAAALAAEGARVEAWDVHFGDVFDAARVDAAPRLTPRVVDVRNAHAVTQAASALSQETGGIDILVNNAGVTDGYLETANITEASWRRVLDTNVTGAMHCVQACAPLMKTRGRGRIVNLSSVFADHGFPGQSSYAASKAALIALTRVWAREFGAFGITVNAISPGYVRTPMNAGHPEPFANLIIGRTALKRLGEAHEIAAAIAFLASDAAAFITGTTLVVDGGLTT